MDNKTDQDHEIIEKLKTDLKKRKLLKIFSINHLIIIISGIEMETDL